MGFPPLGINHRSLADSEHIDHLLYLQLPALRLFCWIFLHSRRVLLGMDVLDRPCKWGLACIDFLNNCSVVAGNIVPTHGHAYTTICLV